MTQEKTGHLVGAGEEVKSKNSALTSSLPANKSELESCHRRKSDRFRSASRVHLSIYVGRDLLGVVVDRDGECAATDAKGQPLGSFATRKDAVNAIWQAHLGMPA
jgi:hypothetical protein